MSLQTFSLHQLGWQSSYAQHLTLADFEAGYPARVMAVHRSGLSILSSRGQGSVVLPHHLADTDTAVAVGDWVLVEHSVDRVLRLIERRSLIARIAAGGEHQRQPIAANVDTLFIVTSCNDDFNPSRLERYLTLAIEAGVEAVIVLTKIDLTDGQDIYAATVRDMLPTVTVVAVNAMEASSAAQLAPWLGAGKTVAFVGSSGVGKSTLTNRIIDGPSQHTHGIREDDAKGRHTTTAREMFPTTSGAWVIDTPGMRELRLGAARSAVDTAFEDIDALAAQCRFRDCQHEDDVGCAVTRAVLEGTLDTRRLDNYRKLLREAAQAQRTRHEQHAHSRKFGVMAKQTMRAKRDRLGR
jgi:ribosome biogenesis GTPase